MRHSVRLIALQRARIPPRTTSANSRFFLRPTFRFNHSNHFSTSCRRPISPALDVQSWTNAKEVVRPSAIWLAPKGSTFNEKQFIEQLPWFQNANEDLPVILILVTPKLAHLLENGRPLHSRIINSIYSGSAVDTLRQSVVAVVDAMPILGKPTGSRQPEVDGCEGIAVCVLPGIDARPARENDENQPLVSMTGRHPFFDGQRYLSISFKGPIANTTFVNGRQSTMYMQNWWKEENQQWLPEPRRQNLSYIDIPVYANVDKDILPAFMNAKVIKVTEPKVISSSMGNIVRLVKDENGQEFAASHELESEVPALVKKIQETLPTVDIRVFAVVYPPELAGERTFADRIWNGGKANTSFHVGLNRKKLLSLLVRGARLYRVTSGGAGWGKKAGLLSLEPKTELDGSSEEPQSLMSFIFGEDEEIRMPGSADLFPPGHVIQFLATCHDSEGLRKTATTIDEAKLLTRDLHSLVPGQWVDPRQIQQFCLGNVVIPEDHEHTYKIDSDTESSNQDDISWKTNPDLIFCPGRFGFLTSSAMSISAKYHSPNQKMQAQMKFGISPPDSLQADMKHKHNTLVEMPNSYFLARFPAGGSISAEAARHSTGYETMKKAIAVKLSSETQGLTDREESVNVAGQRLRTIERLQNETYLRRHDKEVNPNLVRRNEEDNPFIRFTPYDHPLNITRVKTTPISKHATTSPEIAPRLRFVGSGMIQYVLASRAIEKEIRRVRERMRKEQMDNVIHRVSSGRADQWFDTAGTEDDHSIFNTDAKIEEEIDAIEELIEDL